MDEIQNISDSSEDLLSRLDSIIFEQQSLEAFKMICEKEVCKFKYSKDFLLVDKVCEYFKQAVSDNSSSVYYYRKLLFDMLTGEYYCKSRKIKKVIEDLRGYKEKNSNNSSLQCLISFIESLELYGKGYFTRTDRRNISKSYGISSYDDDTSTFYRDDNLSNYVSSLIYPTSNFLDLRSKRIITIDFKNPSARDDAISIEKTDYGYLLGIYITDVSSYLGVDTELFHCAKKRGESLYTYVDDDTYVSMLPNDLTREFFSLESNSERYVVAHFFKFSNSFDLIDYDISRALINVSRNYSYDGVENIERDNCDYDMIYLLSIIADKLKTQFNLEYHLMKESANPLSRKKGISDMVGANIVSASSLFLNSYIAELFKKIGFPYIYRVNSTVAGDTYNHGSSYSSMSFGHIVNNGNCYGHVTTPIRKFSSLLNQYFELSFLVDKSYDNDFIEKWQRDLPNIVDELNMRLFINSEYRDVLETMYAKQLTKRK